MRPVVVTATLLLVALMVISVSAAWNPKASCEAKYPPVPCKIKINNEEWWQMGPNRCAKAYHNVPPLSFNDAEKACQEARHGNFRGYLVSIRDIVELNQAVCIMYREHTGQPHYWIGLRVVMDVIHGMGYRWTDGSKFSFSRWAPDQPDYFMFSEDCVEMNYSEWALWNDESCDAKRPYMCAMNIY
ncbi:C-type lectin galactose-binding isoform-like [Enoplosus armatus]|uniref:C-type lectin galactose-binding isoform-like n=1 Tax=Enoplosus armatus TaxID=215367 RepID=UPI003991E1BF